MTNANERLFNVLLTAHEAYPALEQQFLAAEREIMAGFRIFDPWTTLRSDAAQAVGKTWFDLVCHTLRRGVRLSLVLSDFDPVIRPDMHHYAWTCARALWAAGEASGNPHLLDAHPSMHPARVGLLPRLVLWPRLHKEVGEALTSINEQPAERRAAALLERPMLAPLAAKDGDTYIPRRRPPPLVPVTHHQKLAVFDNTRLYIGGLDLNDRRYDTPAHERAAEDTWHDVQVLVDGPAAQEAVRHLEAFEGNTHGQAAQPLPHILRTVSAQRSFALPYLSPKAVTDELASAHHDQIACANTLIYLETQFFRDKRLAKALAARARAVPDLSLILILPAAPEDAAFTDEPSSDVAYGEHLQVKSLDIIREAFGERAFVGSPAQRRAVAPNGRATHYGAPIIYLHAKVSVFDNQFGIVSSANLNGRSMAWDTEAGLATQSAAEAQHLTSRCFEHWLGPDANPACHEITTARAAWAAQAHRNAGLSPEDRTGFLLPYSAAAAADLGYNVPGVPEELV